jgi:hypothetical protein
MNESHKKWIDDQPIVISFQRTIPKRRIIVTDYEKELSWLFEKFRDIYSDMLDYNSKYAFYGYIAQSVIDYLSVNKNHSQMNELLLYAINKSKEYFENEFTERY